MAKIKYQYLEDGVVCTGTWEGDPDVAAEAAIRFLGAVWDRETQSYMYYKPGTGQVISISENELIRAGAARLSAPGEWYSLWCAETGTPVGR